MTEIREFRIAVPQSDLDDRLARPEGPEPVFHDGPPVIRPFFAKVW